MTTQGQTRPAPISTEPFSAGTLSRGPVTAVFFLNGLTMSTYIARIASLKSEQHLSAGQLGVVGLSFAVAALVAMQFVGPLAARIGNTAILRMSLLGMPLLLAVVGLTDGYLPLVVAVSLFGAAQGTTDAAMNAYAVTIERLSRRPILNSCHGAWSVSAIVASLTTAGLAAADVSLTAHFLGVAAVVVVGGIVVGPVLATNLANAPAGPAEGRARPEWRAGWTAAVVGLGLAAMVVMVCEAAAFAWGAVFLHDVRGASVALSAIAVTAYTAGQTAGRAVGDRLSVRFGARPVFRVGGVVAVAGLVLTVVSPSPPGTIVGLTLMGLGASVLVPLLFSAAGRASTDGIGAAQLLSRLTTFTYGGILLGPALIGGFAQLVGLTWALAGLIPLLAAVTVLSRLPEKG